MYIFYNINVYKIYGNDYRKPRREKNNYLGDK